MIQQTSLDAFTQLQKEGRLNANETIVHDLLKTFPAGLSNFEIADLLHWPVNRVTGRVNALVKKGKVFAFRQKVNVHTRKINIVWAAKVCHPEWPLYHVMRSNCEVSKENGEVATRREVSNSVVGRT